MTNFTLRVQLPTSEHIFALGAPIESVPYLLFMPLSLALTVSLKVVPTPSRSRAARSKPPDTYLEAFVRQDKVRLD